ncbi:MAG: 2Fe-2S ferredoxin [Alphaproteobacteria bacterium]|nr:2Fe-2S ferredoxin [Alphaproteobacteria bacterium]
MVKITYVEHDGTVHVVDVEPGLSVMQGALHNDVPGIDADCGGACACATCHVIVDPAWSSTLSDPDEMEASMLEFVQRPAQGSRLSCQIRVEEALDGLVVRLPETQA